MSEHDETQEVLVSCSRDVTLTFNLKDQNEREIYEWCSEQTDECSTFIKNILSQYKEYREMMQTVSKLHEMLPTLQRMFPSEGSSNLVKNPIQQMNSQLDQAHVSSTPNPEILPSRSARHGGSKRKRASMPME
jgi:hypothetical protein